LGIKTFYDYDWVRIWKGVVGGSMPMGKYITGGWGRQGGDIKEKGRKGKKKENRKLKGNFMKNGRGKRGRGSADAEKMRGNFKKYLRAVG
jgi:hypothetical protein